MAQPYIGEIRIFAGTFPPSGWFLCDGQLVPISENDALFQLLGTTYGGDGEETFAMPNLQSRVPIHQGTLSGGGSYTLGETGGVESVTLATNQIPVHSHPMLCSGDTGSSLTPDNNVLGAGTSVTIYRPQANPGIAMAAAAVQPQGGSQPHDNMQPFICMNYIISQFGIFPTPN
jgi:microcystin-dependent protein